MNYFDIIIAAVLVWAFYSGYKKGIVHMIISLLAIVIGIYAAIHFSYMVLDYIADFMHKDKSELLIIAYILTFVIVFLLMHFVGKILDKFLDAVALGFMNKIAGGALSVGIRVIVLSLALWMFDQANQIYPLVKQKTLDNSTLYNPIKDLSPVILVGLEKLKNNEKLKQLKEKNFKIEDKEINTPQNTENEN